MREQYRKEAKRININNFTRSNRGNISFAIAIFKKMNYVIASKVILHFGSTNIIFVECMYNLLSIQHFTNVQKYDYYLVSFSTKIIIYKRCFTAEKM